MDKEVMNMGRTTSRKIKKPTVRIPQKWKDPSIFLLPAL